MQAVPDLEEMKAYSASRPLGRSDEGGGCAALVGEEAKLQGREGGKEGGREEGRSPGGGGID